MTVRGSALVLTALGFWIALPVRAQTVTFDFDTGTPVLGRGQSTPFDQTSSGVTASFSASSGGGYSIQSGSSTGWKMSRFSGNYLYPNSLSTGALDIRFNRQLTSISLTFATADFQQVEVPTPIKLTAYQQPDGTAVGSATAHGSYAGDTMPMGVISFKAGAQTFNAVEIVIPPQPLAASNFLVDNIVVTAVAAGQPVSLAAVANSAGYAAASLAPGEIVTLFGAGMGPAALAYFALDSNNRVPATLAGARVLFNGFPAPLIYASDKQSAAIVPFEVAGQSTAEIRVEYNGNLSAPVTVPVTNTMPGIFAADGSGRGPGAILNADGSINSPANPAASGSTIVLFAAGLGQLNPAQPNGSVVSGANLPALLYPVTVTIGGRTAQIAYAGPAPQAVAGLYQVNCVVPAGVASGQAPVVVTSDGRQSQPNLTVAVR